MSLNSSNVTKLGFSNIPRGGGGVCTVSDNLAQVGKGSNELEQFKTICKHLTDSSSKVEIDLYSYQH